MTIDLAVSLASIAGTLIMAVTLVLSMKSNRRDRDSMIAATAGWNAVTLGTGAFYAPLPRRLERSNKLSSGGLHDN